MKSGCELFLWVSSEFFFKWFYSCIDGIQVVTLSDVLFLLKWILLDVDLGLWWRLCSGECTFECLLCAVLQNGAVCRWRKETRKTAYFCGRKGRSDVSKRWMHSRLCLALYVLCSVAVVYIWIKQRGESCCLRVLHCGMYVCESGTNVQYLVFFDRFG